MLSELDLHQEYKTENYKGYYNYLETLVQQEEFDILIYDNPTTSIFYGESPSQQSEVASRLKQLAKKQDVPIFMVAHTKSTVTDQYQGLIEDADIRGSKKLTNLVEFLYVFQRFSVESQFYPTTDSHIT